MAAFAIVFLALDDLLVEQPQVWPEPESTVPPMAGQLHEDVLLHELGNGVVGSCVGASESRRRLRDCDDGA